MGIEPDDRFERLAREKAVQHGWTFEKLQGDLSLLQALVDGPWDDARFLIVPPGHRVAASFDEGIVRVEEEQTPSVEGCLDRVVAQRSEVLRRLAES